MTDKELIRIEFNRIAESPPTEKHPSIQEMMLMAVDRYQAMLSETNKHGYRVYRFDSDNQRTWYCARTHVECMKVEMALTDNWINEYNLSEDDIVLIPKHQWSDVKILVDGETQEIDQSVAQYMETANGPDIICSTAYL